MAQTRVYSQPKHKEALSKIGFHWCKKDCRFEKNGGLKQDQQKALDELKQKDPTIRSEYVE